MVSNSTHILSSRHRDKWLNEDVWIDKFDGWWSCVNNMCDKVQPKCFYQLEREREHVDGFLCPRKSGRGAHHTFVLFLLSHVSTTLKRFPQMCFNLMLQDFYSYHILLLYLSIHLDCVSNVPASHLARLLEQFAFDWGFCWWALKRVTRRKNQGWKWCSVNRASPSHTEMNVAHPPQHAEHQTTRLLNCILVEWRQGLYETAIELNESAGNHTVFLYVESDIGTLEKNHFR